METVSEDGQSPNSDLPYSGFWRRVAATVIDNLLLIVPAFALSTYGLDIVALLLLLAYGTYFESSARRATLGKQACGLIVERASGERLSVGKALGRQMLKLLGNVLSIISWLIFFLPVVFTAKKQGLHDLAVSSVVRHEPGKGMPDWLVGVCAAVVPGVAVIGMLAAIAIPAYQDYTIRAKVVAGRAQAAPLRVAVEAAYAKRGLLPNDQAELDSVAATADAGVAYRNGRIAIALNVGSKQAALFLTPVVESNGIIWKCSAENLRSANLPADCR